MEILDWHSGKFSKLEETLRLPKVKREVLWLLLRRPFLVWIISFVCLDFISNSEFLIWSLSFVLVFFVEMFRARAWFPTVLNAHNNKLKQSIETYNDLKSDANGFYKDEFVEAIVSNSAWSIAHFLYLYFFALLWKACILRILPLILKDLSFEESSFFVSGFEDKSFELSSKLYSYSTQGIAFDSPKVEEFFGGFTGRLDAWDISQKTIAESSAELESIFNNASQIKAPSETLKMLQEQRNIVLQKVLNNTVIPKNLMQKFLTAGQGTCKFLDDCKYYAFEYDFYIRDLLFLYAERGSIDNNTVFEYTWDALRSFK